MSALFDSLLERTLKLLFICRSSVCADNLPMESVRANRRICPRAGGLAALVPMFVFSLCLLLISMSPAVASGDDDHDRARAAVQAGEVLPLALVLERLERTHPGQLLALELEREDGRWIYEVKLLQADGRLLKLHVDARTAQVLKIRSNQGQKRERRDDRSIGGSR